MYTQLLVHIEELEIVLLLFCKYAKIVLLDLQAIPVLYNLFIQDPGDQPGILEMILNCSFAIVYPSV